MAKLNEEPVHEPEELPINDEMIPNIPLIEEEELEEEMQFHEYLVSEEEV
jgi:hypothetical protein